VDRAERDEARGAGDVFAGLPPAAEHPPPTDDEKVQRLLDRASIRDAAVAATPRDPMHLLNNHSAVIDGDTAIAETYAYVGEPWHEGATRFVDRFERVGPGWRLVDRVTTDNWLR
jgi:hypothetical protein